MYLLDTNILSELVKKRPNPQVLSQLRSKAALTLFTSCICIMELRFGSALSEEGFDGILGIKKAGNLDTSSDRQTLSQT